MLHARYVQEKLVGDFYLHRDISVNNFANTPHELQYEMCKLVGEFYDTVFFLKKTSHWRRARGVVWIMQITWLQLA